jgi:hypothetical protein
VAVPVVAFAMVRVREIVFVRGAVVGARVVARVAVPCAAFLFFVVVVMVVVLAIFSLPASKSHQRLRDLLFRVSVRPLPACPPHAAQHHHQRAQGHGQRDDERDGHRAR